MRDELQFALMLARELPAHELASFLGEIETIRYTAIARLSAHLQAPPTDTDRLLSIEEASERHRSDR